MIAIAEDIDPIAGPADNFGQPTHLGEGRKIRR
jgi:hypothetical protein